ncbi:hypothetical protein QI425_12965 [Staphylococcus aureus]|nr:hypothetical protein [Staphylococcus aureus]MDI1662481.1 hypothetical protein [Staphylococcus aureus]MDI1957427.1 hypothetical protein [Staphylococcus aureus]HEA3944444.1 hypothetical protein [Staphylococcus aureus]
MLKKTMFPLMLLFIFSMVIFFLSLSYKENKINILDNAKIDYKNNQLAITSLKEQQIDNEGFLNELKNHPDEIVKNSKKRVEHFVKVLKEGQDKNTDEKTSYFQTHLNNHATKTIIQNDELKNITIPKNYDLFINTSRGHYIQFMLKDRSKEDSTTYYTITYNNSTHKVENIIEYHVNS